MFKYIILDMGKVLVEPTTGYWTITPTFRKNVDIDKIDKNRLKEAVKSCSIYLDGRAKNLEEEYNVILKYYIELFKAVEYAIPEHNLENIVRDFVYNENDNKYYLYDDVKEELQRLSKNHTILMLSDNWPCAEEYLKKYDIYKFFTKIYISSVYGVQKKEGIFFNYPINDFKIKKGEALFIDDNEGLLDIAAEKGLDVMLMDRRNTVEKSKYKVIHSLKEIL